MLESNKKEFASIVSATLKVYRAEADTEVLKLWWAVLSRYDMADVRAGFSAFLSSPSSKFQPVPADIVGAIDKAKPDGRPGADEAWAMIPRDESASVVWTNEMAEAWGIANALLIEGDAIAARRSFIDAYNRIVDANKRAGMPPRWMPSLGRDVEGRRVVLEAAQRLGRLPAQQVAGLLPMLEVSGVMAAVLALPSAAPLTEDEKEAGRARIERMKQQIRVAA